MNDITPVQPHVFYFIVSEIAHGGPYKVQERAASEETAWAIHRRYGSPDWLKVYRCEQVLPPGGG